jgi:uncharacterized FlaG/YvyC family protein
MNFSTGPIDKLFQAPVRESSPSTKRKQSEPPQKEASAPSPQAPVDDAEVEKAARELERRFEVKVELAQDELTGRSVVRVFSPDGERLLRQLPPDAALQLAYRARRDSLLGILA